MSHKINYGNLERNILLYIWIWKLTSQANLKARFFKDRAVMSAYKYMLRMEKRNLVKVIPCKSGRTFVWSLTRKGFMAISNLLPALKENGYASECPYHDLLVSSVMYEDMLKEPSQKLKIVTEQQLRRYECESLPDWTPEIELRRPDGYWKVTSNGKSSVIALEVELSMKKDTEYEFMGQLYGDCKAVTRVLWMVRTNKQAIKLDNILNQKKYCSKPKHNFVLESDYLMTTSQTEIFRGPERTKHIGRLLGFPREKLMKKFSYSAILDGRRYPEKTKGYKIYEKFENHLYVDI